MNPFDLRGPEFLLFYVVLALFTFAALFAWQRFHGPQPTGDRLLRDPYLVAGLRGGEQEIVRVAVFSLLARGFLVRGQGSNVGLQAGSQPVPQDPVPLDPVPLDPVERAVVQALRGGPQGVARLQHDRAIMGAARPHMQALASAGLLTSEAETRARARAATIAGLFLVVVAAIKLLVALQRGRSNVLFLIVLAAFCVWGCVAWARTLPRTREGERVLADLRGLFGSRRARCPNAPAAGATPDLVLLAAVGGIVGAPFAHAPRSRERRGEGSSGCATSCSGGAGSGGSCGGSCGGGCGGCGS